MVGNSLRDVFGEKEYNEIMTYFREVYESDYDRKIMFSERVSILCPENYTTFGTYRLRDCVIGTDIKSVLIVCDVILDGSVFDYVMTLKHSFPWLECIQVSCLRCSDMIIGLDDYFVRVTWGKGYMVRQYSLKLFDSVSDVFDAPEVCHPVEKRALDLFTEYNDVYSILYNFFRVTNDSRLYWIQEFAKIYDDRLGCPRLVELCHKLDASRTFEDLMSIEPARVYADDNEIETLPGVIDVCKSYYRAE